MSPTTRLVTIVSLVASLLGTFLSNSVLGAPSMIMAVGMEKIVSTYSGPLVRIQRASDNAQEDISFATGSKALNMASVSAFLGSNVGYIVELYDQSGSGNNVLAPTATANMPTICAVAPTAITNSGTTYLTGRNNNSAYEHRYLILPSTLSVSQNQASAFLAMRLDYSGSFNGYMSLYEIGDPVTAAFDIYSLGSGFQGLTINAGTSTQKVAFPPDGIFARTQPTVLGLVTTPGAAATLYLDGVAHTAGGSAPQATTCTGGYLLAGTGTSYYFGGPLLAKYNFLGFVVYNGTVDAATAQSISNTLLPRTVPLINIVADGDSITQGTGDNYGWDTIRYVEPLLSQPVDITNIAVYGSPSGSALGHITSPTTASSPVGQLYNSSYLNQNGTYLGNIYYLDIGTNDIHNGATAASAWTNVQQCLVKAKAMGFKTIVGTLLHEGTTAYPETTTASTEINNFNAFVRSAYASQASYIDAMVDYDADSRLDLPNYYPTYTADGTHPNDAGYQVFCSHAAPVFNSIIAQISPTTFPQWQQAKFGTTTGNAAATATPQNDGVNNLIKYLCNVNPTVPMSATDKAAVPIAGTITSGGTQYFTLTYRKNSGATGITVNLQASTDMVTWTTVTPDFSQRLPADAITGDPYIQTGVSITGNMKFIRLNVTMP